VMMETQKMEMVAQAFVLLKVVGHALEVVKHQSIFALKFVEMD
jgi:hypothetical protein